MDTSNFNDDELYPGAKCEMRLMTYQQRHTFERQDVINDGDKILQWAQKLWVGGENLPDEEGDTIKDFKGVTSLKLVNIGFLINALYTTYSESKLSEDERKK